MQELKCWHRTKCRSWNVDIVIHAEAEMLTLPEVHSLLKDKRYWTSENNISFQLHGGAKRYWTSENNISIVKMLNVIQLKCWHRTKCRSWNVDIVIHAEAEMLTLPEVHSLLKDTEHPKITSHFNDAEAEMLTLRCPARLSLGHFICQNDPKWTGHPKINIFFFKMILTKIVICLNLAKH